jgi:hypothetical protein
MSSKVVPLNVRGGNPNEYRVKNQYKLMASLSVPFRIMVLLIAVVC